MREVEEWNPKLEITPLVETQRHRKHQWTGHSLQCTDDRRSFNVLKWEPELVCQGVGRRARGGETIQSKTTASVESLMLVTKKAGRIDVVKGSWCQLCRVRLAYLAAKTAR
jgi:hypothetical protein